MEVLLKNQTDVHFSFSNSHSALTGTRVIQTLSRAFGRATNESSNNSVMTGQTERKQTPDRDHYTHEAESDTTRRLTHPIIHSPFKFF